MDIGLIGAENSHARHFCAAAKIRYIYGADDPVECARLCDEFGLENCESEDEVIAKSDAVAVTYRRGSEHYAPVMAALRAGKPVFNDKPFTTDLQQAEEIVALAKELNIPLTGGSSLKGLSALPAIQGTIGPGSTVVISFAADPASPYDGYWFYGMHAAELCVLLCGRNFTGVRAFENRGVVVSHVSYPDRQCILVTAPQSGDLKISVTNGGETTAYALPLDYQDVGPGELVAMAQTGRPPRDYAHYTKAVELVANIIETAGCCQP
ncbi:MAG: Gfo/Idh/MocA family oxidoreductase [Firmicutes bacterium]|nr:Gfo/Idh/MocA family oxidoreductase [Bacillota bacterium]